MNQVHNITHIVGRMFALLPTVLVLIGMEGRARQVEKPFAIVWRFEAGG